MRTGSIIRWPEIGAELAHCDGEKQAMFLKSFFRELRHACTTHYRTELQLACVYELLSKEDRELAAMLTDGGNPTTAPTGGK